jgi:hypothetical protein
MQTSRWFATVVLILVAPTSVGCGVRRSGDWRADPAMSPSVAMEIRQAEIDALRERVSSVYDLIRRLRPAMLNSRDPSASPMEAPYAPLAAPGMTVYVDGVYVGGLEALSTISARAVTSIRRISSATASAQFGAGLSAGAIVITTDVPSHPRVWDLGHTRVRLLSRHSGSDA